jgi:hypothetical protein
VIDVIAGIILATATFVLMQLLWPWLERSKLFELPDRASDWGRRTLSRLRPAGNG